MSIMWTFLNVSKPENSKRDKMTTCNRPWASGKNTRKSALPRKFVESLKTGRPWILTNNYVTQNKFNVIKNKMMLSFIISFHSNCPKGARAWELAERWKRLGSRPQWNDIKLLNRYHTDSDCISDFNNQEVDVTKLCVFTSLLIVIWYKIKW